MIYFDSETCGFTGPMILLQWAEDDGPIHLHEVWNEKISTTLRLLERLADSDVCGFNLVFDWFHVVKIYNVLRTLYDAGYDDLPTVDSVAKVDAVNPSEYCLKPKSALDLMLCARRGKYQYVMDRKDINVRRVPRIVAEPLADVLKERIEFPDICFARSDDGYKWRTRDNEEHSDVYLRFSGSTGLRALAAEILGEDKADWPIPDHLKPTELSWRPYGVFGNKPWTACLPQAVAMWGTNSKARYYAEKDVDLTRKLHLVGFPEEQGGDTDSELACAVGATRWRGFELDHDHISTLIPQYERESTIAPRAPHAARQWLEMDLGDAEKMMLEDTSKASLETLERDGSNDEVKRKARLILQARRAQNRLTLCQRLLEIPRFHPEFKIIGTKSNRQSGGGDGGGGGSINPQGIPHDKSIRRGFTFARPHESLWGGDAVSCQVTIIDAVFPDPRLHEELLSGKSFHALMGRVWYNVDYEEMARAKVDQDDDRYARAKAANFALTFGAEGKKLAQVLDLGEDEGQNLSSVDTLCILICLGSVRSSLCDSALCVSPVALEQR